MLSSYRVLDLTGERGLLCGQILADLGADVVQVEPPWGSDARRLPPFYRDQPNLEHSLRWWAFTRNKRGITLDLEAREGREILTRLVESTDVLIESETPGVMAGRGLGYPDLGAHNPALVYVSITAFGQDGPKARYADTDLTVMAASGPLQLTGDRDRAPLRLSVPQAWAHASAEAAAAALVALHERRRSGRGQHVDVSAQQAVALATLSAILGPALGSPAPERVAGRLRVGLIPLRTTYPAQDGYVVLVLGLFPPTAAAMKRLIQWMHEEGCCDDAIRNQDFASYGPRLLRGELAHRDLMELEEAVARFLASKTKQELFEGAVERKLLLAPVLSLSEIAESPHLAEREFPRPVEHPELGRRFLYPGPFARFQRTPIRYRSGPPRLGEHNHEILGDELGYDDAELEALRQRGVIG